MPESPATVEEVFSCDLNGGTAWVHGHVDKRKFKGSLLSKPGRLLLLEDMDEWDQRHTIVTGKVHHGWVITVAGDTSHCGWDATTYFRDKAPEVVDGKWDPDPWRTVHIDPEDPDSGVYGPREVVDGPHEATWLDVR